MLYSIKNAVSFSVVWSLMLWPMFANAGISADTVLTNGKLYTVNKAQPWAEAIAIKGNKVVFVGDNAQAQSFIGDKTVVKDLDDKMVLPGLIDSHGHPALSGFYGAGLRFSPSDNKQVLLDKIKTYAESHKELPVIFGGGWATLLFGEDGPQKEDLDRVVPDRPVILYGQWGHTHWVNSKALSILGIDKNTPDPLPGVHVYKRDSQGNPTGWIKDMPAPSAKGLQVTKQIRNDSYSIIKAYSDQMTEFGITTLYDAGMMGFEDYMYPLLQEGMSTGDIRYRILGSYHITEASHAKNAVSEVQRLAAEYDSDMLKVTTVKLHLDGIYEAYTAGMMEDYEGRPGEKGGMIMTTEQVKTLILEVEHAGLDLHIHSIGDRTTHESLNAVEMAIKELGRPLKSRISLCHLEFIADNDFKRFKELGVIASITPLWNGADNNDYVAIVGKDRAKKVLRFMPLITQGAVVSASSDGVMDPRTEPEGVTEINPFAGIETGYTRQALGDPSAKVMLPENERIPLDKMIEAYTLNGAIQLHLEDEVGSLEVGKRADLIVLDNNLFDISKYEIHKVTVEMTMVDGNIVHCTTCAE